MLKAFVNASTERVGDRREAQHRVSTALAEKERLYLPSTSWVQYARKADAWMQTGGRSQVAARIGARDAQSQMASA